MLCHIDLFCDGANGSSGHYASLNFLIATVFGLHVRTYNTLNEVECARDGSWPHAAVKCNSLETRKRDEGEEKET